MIKYPFRQVGDADKRQKFEIGIVQLWCVIVWQCSWYLVRWRLWIQNLVISEIMTAEGWRRCWGLLLGKSASICLQMEEFNNSECSLILIVQWIFYILQWMLYWKYLTLNEFLGNSFISLFESLKHQLPKYKDKKETYVWYLDVRL